MKETKLIVIADTHHFSKTLGDNGRQYYLRSGSDQKCLMETGDILQAAFSEIAESDADAVLIAGDLSNDGERVSHEEFREMLYQLQKSKPVYVITATHDWCSDENPRKFSGNAVYHDVPVLAPQELRDFYRDFGPDASISEYVTHLGTSSYTIDVGENVRILALNDDQNMRGAAGYSEAHFQWIDAQIRQAKADGKTLIGMQHHLLVPHVHPMLTGRSCVGDREQVAARLADAGLRYLFVGHSHFQCTDVYTSPAGSKLTVVNVASLVGYPAPMAHVTVSDEGVHMHIERLKSFEFQGKTIDAQPYLAAHAEGLIDRIVEGALISPNEFADRLSAMGLKGENFKNLYYPVHPFAKLYFNATAKTVYRVLRCLGCGRFIDPAALEAFRDTPIKQFVHDTWLSILDGQGKGANDPLYCKLVLGVADALVHLRACGATLEIRQALRSIITAKNPEDTVI